MNAIETRIARLERSIGPVASQRPYALNPALSVAENEHAASLHDFLQSLGPVGVDALLSTIAANGRRLVPEIAG